MVKNSELTIDLIIEYLHTKEKKQASTELINKNFIKLGYSKGQISGLLHRGVKDLHLEKPYRAVYRISEKNVLELLTMKIESVRNYIQSVPLVKYQQMNENDKDKFNKLSQLIMDSVKESSNE